MPTSLDAATLAAYALRLGMRSAKYLLPKDLRYAGFGTCVSCLLVYRNWFSPLSDVMIRTLPGLIGILSVIQVTSTRRTHAAR